MFNRLAQLEILEVYLKDHNIPYVRTQYEIRVKGIVVKCLPGTYSHWFGFLDVEENGKVHSLQMAKEVMGFIGEKDDDGS